MARYADVIGIDCTVDLILAFGGTEIHVARRPGRDSRLAQVIGHNNALALAAVAERLPARVPVARRWIATVLHARGATVVDIARRLHVSDVTVRAYIGGGGRWRDPRQADFF